MTEMEKLKHRLFGDPDIKLKNFHVDWGPKAHLLTTEERAKVINDAFDQIESGDYKVVDSFGDRGNLQTDVRTLLDSHIPVKTVLE